MHAMTNNEDKAMQFTCQTNGAPISIVLLGSRVMGLSDPLFEQRKTGECFPLLTPRAIRL